jgi:hypothetical protein
VSSASIGIDLIDVATCIYSSPLSVLSSRVLFSLNLLNSLNELRSIRAVQALISNFR